MTRLSGASFAVVASRFPHGRASFSPGIGGIAGAAPGRDHDRLPRDEHVVADADALLAVEPARAHARA